MDITDQLLLTAEEIYYLAKTNNGRFLDYDYISAMDNIGDNKSVFEEKCKRSLMGKKLIDEDFDGNMTMPQSVMELIEPIYNGDYESMFSYIDGTDSSFVARIHRLDSGYTLVLDKAEGYEIKTIEEKSIEKMIEDSIKIYSDIEIPSEITDKDSLDTVIVVKAIEPEKESLVNVFYGNGKGIYEEQDDGIFKNIQKDIFIKRVTEILKGV